MVLLIVLLILMMTTATATFAVHSTGYEIQAAGSMRQALRTRNIAEGMASALTMYASSDTCQAGSNIGQTAGNAFSINVAKYGYPNVGSDAQNETVMTIPLANLAQDPTFENNPIPDDSMLSSSSFAPMYLPNVEAIAECMPVGKTAAGESNEALAYRVRLTVFGEMAPSTDSMTTGALRKDHETVSVSRVYMNVVGPPTK
jgi:hypothetical protein